MKLFKQIDFRMQVILIITGVIIAASNSYLFYWSYFLVGGWQILSTVIHLFAEEFFIHYTDRRHYNVTLLWVIIIGCICAATPFLIFFLIAILFVSPVMAVWYTFICKIEIALLKRKEFIHLK